MLHGSQDKDNDEHDRHRKQHQQGRENTKQVHLWDPYLRAHLLRTQFRILLCVLQEEHDIQRLPEGLVQLLREGGDIFCILLHPLQHLHSYIVDRQLGVCQSFPGVLYGGRCLDVQLIYQSHHEGQHGQLK